MVNGGFPEPTPYGFERVDAGRAAGLSRNSAINRKFTPNRIIRVFGEFSALQTQYEYL
jgi:hypothetical protein